MNISYLVCMRWEAYIYSIHISVGRKVSSYSFAQIDRQRERRGNEKWPRRHYINTQREWVFTREGAGIKANLHNLKSRAQAAGQQASFFAIYRRSSYVCTYL